MPGRALMRKSRTPRIYDSQKWHDLRLMYFSKHPLCVDCKSRGKVTAASHVVHVTSVADAPELAWIWSNLQALCHSCHSEKTAQVDGGFCRKKGRTSLGSVQ